MTVVRDVVRDAENTPIPGAIVLIDLLVGPTAGGVGFLDGATISREAQIEAGATGAWSADLAPQSAITPAGTVYRVRYATGPRAQFAIIVPATGGPYDIDDILAELPATGPAAVVSARNVTYDNTLTGLDATNVQDAIDEGGGGGGGATTFAGDVSGHPTTTQVDKIKGIPVAGTRGAGKALVDDGTNLVYTDVATQAELDAEAAARLGADSANTTAVTAEATTRANAVTAEAAARVAGDLLAVPLTQKGNASGVATLDGGGRVPAAQLPSLVLSHTYVVGSQAAMLALSAANVGDVAVRTDVNETFILNSPDMTVLGNWTQLLFPGGGAVTSVNTRTGAVTGVAEESALDAETARAEAAESTNATAISSEATTRATADTTNATAITAEASTARAAESANAAAITSEATARASAVSAEATARAAADTTNASAIASEATTRASADTANAAAIAAEATTARAAEALAMHGLVRTAVKTANYTAVSGDLVPCDSTSAGFTVTLPAAANGAIVAVKHIIQGSTNTVTVACAGSDVLNKTSGATTLTLTLLAQGVVLIGAAGIWTVVADDLALAQLDLRFEPLLADPIPVAKGGTGGATVAAAKTSLGLSSVFGIFGGLTVLGHSYTQKGGNNSDADQAENFTHRVAAAVQVSPEDWELWGKSSAMAASPSTGDGSNGLVQGVGVAMRHIYPSHWYTPNQTPFPASKAKAALFVLMYGYNEPLGDINLTVAANAYQQGMRTIISRCRLSHLYNDDHASIAYGGGHWTNPAHAYLTKGTSHQTVTNADTFTITIPTDFLGGVVSVFLHGNKNLGPTLNGNITNVATTVVVNSNWVGLNTFAAGDVILIGTEQILVGATADGLTLTGCTRAYNGTSAATHTSGDVVSMPTSTATVTWSGTSGVSGTTGVAGVGTAFGLQIVKRFTLTNAAAGKTIIGTLGGLVGNEKLIVDSWGIEDTNLPYVLVLNQFPNTGGGVIFDGTNLTTINGKLTALCGASGEFDANVVLVDLATPFTALTRTTLNTSIVAGDTTLSLNPSDATQCLVGVGTRLHWLNNSLATEDALVTAITKTDNTHWSVTVTRSYNGTTAGSTTAGATSYVYDHRFVRSDDIVHPTDAGHQRIAGYVLDALATAAQTTLQIAASGGNTARRRVRVRDNGFYYVIEEAYGQARVVNTLPTKDLLCCYPFEITESCEIIEMGIEVTTGGASSLVRFGIWADGAGRPGVLLSEYGSVATTGTGEIVVAGFVPMKPGWVWLGYTFNTTAGTTMPAIREFGSGNILPPRGYRIPINVRPSNANTGNAFAEPAGITYASVANGTSFIDNPYLTLTEAYLASGTQAFPVFWIKPSAAIRD